MDDEEAGAGNARQGPPPKADSIQGSVERLIAAGKDLAEAEISWAKLKGASLAAILRRGVFFAILATTGLMVGFSLLLVAGIIALSPHVGFLYGTLIMIGIAFAIALLFGWLARRAFRQLMGASDS